MRLKKISLETLRLAIESTKDSSGFPRDLVFTKFTAGSMAGDYLFAPKSYQKQTFYERNFRRKLSGDVPTCFLKYLMKLDGSSNPD